MSSSSRKRDIILVYLRNIAGGLIALPVSLVIVTTLIVMAVLLLPVIWGMIILWWVNGFRHIVTGEKQDYTECFCEDDNHVGH